MTPTICGQSFWQSSIVHVNRNERDREREQLLCSVAGVDTHNRTVCAHWGFVGRYRRQRSEAIGTVASCTRVNRPRVYNKACVFTGGRTAIEPRVRVTDRLYTLFACASVCLCVCLHKCVCVCVGDANRMRVSSSPAIRSTYGDGRTVVWQCVGRIFRKLDRIGGNSGINSFSAFIFVFIYLIISR